MSAPLPVSRQAIIPYATSQYAMGAGSDGQKSFSFNLADSDMDHHMAVLGGTGSGKSKFLERLIRGFMLSGRGLCFIDPHGDTSEDLLAWAAWKKNVEKEDALWRRIHYLEPSYEMVFGYDPFKFRLLHEIPPKFRDSAYEAWLHTKVDRVSEILQRKQNQFGFEGMPQLQRMLRNVLYGVGRALDNRGRHLPLADALVLLDVNHGRHDEVFHRVAPFLDQDILPDFIMLRSLRREEDRMRQINSTVNRLRSFLGPIVRGIFSETVNTIDFHSIMQQGEILLVNLRETDYFSADQASAIGGLFIHEILTTAANMPRQNRREFSLVIDEVGEYIGQDLMRALGSVRKYKLSLVLAGQDLSTFQKGDVDLAPKVLSQCGTVVCFQQQYVEDLKILADRLFRGNLNFEELYQVMDRPDGTDFLDMEDYSESFTWNDGWNESGSISCADTVTNTRSAQFALQRNWSDGINHQVTNGSVDTKSNATAKGENSTLAYQNILRDGMKIADIPALSFGKNSATHDARSHADSRTEADGASHQEGGGITNTNGLAEAIGRSLGITVSEGKSGSNGGGRTVSHRKQAIQRYREEWHPSGKLRHQVSDQLEQFMTLLYLLGTAECVVKLKSGKQAFGLQVAQVREKWLDTENKFRQIELLKKDLQALRSYFFAPALSTAAQDDRIDAYLATEDNGHANVTHTDGNGHHNGHKNGTNGKPNGHVNSSVNRRNGYHLNGKHEEEKSAML